MDTFTWRVYCAEQSIDVGDDLPDIAAARALVTRVCRSSWWRQQIGPVPALRVKLSGRDTPDGWMESWAAPNRDLCPDAWVLHIHPRMLNPVVVLHEVAHTIAARMTGELHQIRRGRVSWLRLHQHGPEFTGAFAELLARFGTGSNHADLADAYRHYEVPVMDLEQVLAARAHSDAVEQAVAEVLEQADREYAATAAASQQGGARPTPWIPDIEWGWWLRSARRWRPGVATVSQVKLARAISPVERCTARDVAAVETARQPPTDPRLRRIAMAAVAVLGLDPIWARTEVGLVRWECGIELDELESVAPDWVATVNHLNELAEARPPLWRVQGAR